MEASETLRRIFWRHRWLLIALVILPVAVVVPFLERQPPSFAATAHVQGAGQIPTVDTQVQAVQAQVSAVATNPAIVRKAISDAHVQRDALTVARHHVSVTPLGTSAVMQVTLTDPSRSVALRLDTALANEVVAKLAGLGIQSNPQLAVLAKTNQQLTTQRDKLIAQLSASSPPSGSGNVQVQSLLTELGAVEQQLSSNQSAVQELLNSVSTGATVLGAPTFATGTSRHVLEYGALAGLLGLLIGLLIATVREVVRPTVAEPAAGARELGAVLLGDAETAAGAVTGLDDDLATRLDRAAERSGARTLVLTGPVPRLELSALAYRLGRTLSAGNADEGAARAGGPAAHAVSYAGIAGRNGRPSAASDATLPAGFGTGSGSGPPGTTPVPPPLTVVALQELSRGAHLQDPALVVVLPRFAPHAAVDRIKDLGDTTGWPVLGVIGLRRKKKAAPRPGAAGAGYDAGGEMPAGHVKTGVAK